MSKTNPYNLPPPWNAGYSLPQNVEDEGLERHGYVTAWAQRGSFDNPKVGDGGYEVPAYIMAEPYGQGAMVTKWAPRGSYAGPKVRHWLDRPVARVVGRKKLPGGATQMQIAALSGTEERMTGGATPFTDYGLKSARAMLETVKMMPPGERKRQLKRALDKIDPHLWSRAEQAASLETKAGVPDAVALERGLAAAMSLGITSEIVALGKGKRPAKRSQLGAVMALGDDPTSAGSCWVGPIPGGHWERVRAGQTSCTDPQPDGGGGPTVRTGGSGGITVTDASGNVVKTKLTSAPSPADQKFLNIGPFLIPVTSGTYRDHRTLTGDKQKYVDENIAIAAKAGGISTAEMKTGKYPFVKFKANEVGWGLFCQVKPDGTTIVSYSKISPKLGGMGAVEALGLSWSDLEDAAAAVGGAIKDVAVKVAGAVWDVLKKIWEGIKWVAAKVVDFVKDAAAWIEDKACKLMSSGIGQMGAAAAGAYLGGPAGAQAGAMGAQVIAKACADAPPVCPPDQMVGPDGKTCVPIPPGGGGGGGSSMLPLLLIGGAGIAAILLLGGKKKKKP